MKWDKTNKEKLYRGIYLKFRDMKRGIVINDRHLRNEFLKSHNIVRCDRRRVGKSRKKWLFVGTDNSAAHCDRIIILDPWHGWSENCPDWGLYNGLSIPKSVAEKFLILGVP